MELLLSMATGRVAAGTDRVVEADATPHRTRGLERAPTPVMFLLFASPVVSSGSGK